MIKIDDQYSLEDRGEFGYFIVWKQFRTQDAKAIGVYSDGKFWINQSDKLPQEIKNKIVFIAGD